MLVFAWSASLRWKIEMHSIPAASACRGARGQGTRRNAEGSNTKARRIPLAVNRREVSGGSVIRQNSKLIAL